MKFFSTLLFSLTVSWALIAQENERHITFPDLENYQTLICDFHIHTVFSDGNVWPSIRIDEAVKDGLDAIALTEHIEYQPHAEDIPHPDRNRSYILAKEYAKPFDLLVIHGTEITRDMPPGHANAIFVQDVNKLIIDDPVEAYREAKNQGAFIFWNHPNWVSQYQDGIAKLSEMHKQLIREGLLDGIEVVNDLTYSDEALQIAIDNHLTVMGTSDIHGLVDWQFMIPEGGHRPVSLVFATEKSESAIKEALEAGRTIAWFYNQLIGPEVLLKSLINSSIEVKEANYQGPTSVLTVKVYNHSDAKYLLQNTSNYTFHARADIVEILPHTESTIQIKTKDQVSGIEVSFQVLNAIFAPNQHPEIKLNINPEFD